MVAIGPEIPPHLLRGPESAHDSEPEQVGPQIPPQALGSRQPIDNEDEDGEEDYIPSLPPDLIAERSRLKASSSSLPTNLLAGPSMAPSYLASNSSRLSDGDSDDDIGPKPLPAGISFQNTDGVQEFMLREERRQKQIEVSSHLPSMLTPTDKVPPPQEAY